MSEPTRPAFPEIGSIRSGPLVLEPVPIAPGASDKEIAKYMIDRAVWRRYGAITMEVEIVPRPLALEWAHRAVFIQRRHQEAREKLGEDKNSKEAERVSLEHIQAEAELHLEVLAGCITSLCGFDLGGKSVELLTDRAELVRAIKSIGAEEYAGERAQALQNLRDDQRDC